MLAVFPESPHDAPGSHTLLTALTRSASADRNRFEAAAQLVDILSHGERVIVIDEAERLNRECIEFLRPTTTRGRRSRWLLVGGDGRWESAFARADAALAGA